MKKGFRILILIAVLLPFSTSAINKIPDSLSKFYFKASVGYGLGINGELVENTDKDGNITNTQSKLGTGFGFSASAGYQLFPHLGFEMGIGYFTGIKTNLFSSYYGSETNNGTIIQCVPSVVFASRLGHFHPYLKLGLILALPEVYAETTEIDKYSPNQATTDSKFKYYNGLALGVQTVMGCTVPLSNSRFSIFAEVSFSNVGYFPERYQKYAQTVNGTDDLSKLTISDKQSIYKTKLSNTTTNPSDQPSYYLQTLIHFNTLAFNIGLKWNLGNLSIPTSDERKENPFYVRLQVGYGFEENGDLYYDDQEESHDLQTTYFSGGSGLNIGLGAGYMINENLGVDLGANYAFGASLKTKYGVLMPHENPFLFPDEPIGSLNGNMLQVNPSVVLATHIQKIKPYARIGMLIGAGEINSVYDYNIPISNSYPGLGGQFHYAYKLYGGIALGYNAVLGIAYPLRKNMDIYTEAAFNNIYYVPTNGALIQYSKDGVNQLPNINNYSKTINFKYSYNESVFANYPDKVQIASPLQYSFNTIVASIGVRVWL